MPTDPEMDRFNLTRSVISAPLIEHLHQRHRRRATSEDVVRFTHGLKTLRNVGDSTDQNNDQTSNTPNNTYTDPPVQADAELPHLEVIIELNMAYKDGIEKAASRLKALLIKAEPELAQTSGSDRHLRISSQFVFARINEDTLHMLVDREHDLPRHERIIQFIWPDFDVEPHLHRSIPTVKADAAHIAFCASGKGVVWAVLDSGIQGDHPHFKKNDNLNVTLPIQHMDFTGSGDPLQDPFGHGTHVAGIIAGTLENSQLEGGIKAFTRTRVDRMDPTTREIKTDIKYMPEPIDRITGVAPECKVVSFRVLDQNGKGKTSNIIMALNKINEINSYGRSILIHGVNLSVGYGFEAEWFACGQSPLCTEVNRLVKSGVVVVVAAGNTGYGTLQTDAMSAVKSPLQLSINDPGNAELAITVGATHRDQPHTYGVSYFSSKGPTGDGRLKPDLVAPGEKILSCAAGTTAAAINLKTGTTCHYVEDSGTSMAAPHVSGAVAAFLSIRKEFIGQPEKVKKIFMDSAIDLGRSRDFQGKGLVDLMRAIQSV